MKKKLKYEDLSKDIKQAIDTFRSEEESSGVSIGRDAAMETWFRDHFEDWLNGRTKADSRNKRKHRRLDIELPLSVAEVIVESSGEEPHVDDLVGTIINISRGGFYFFTRQPIPVSTIIKVAIDFSAMDPELQGIEALAMVVRSEAQSHGRFGVGVMFSSIYDEEKESLELFIFKQLAYHMHAAS